MQTIQAKAVVSFKGREYAIGEQFKVNPILAAEGMVAQLAIFGKRNASGLMQRFSNGYTRVIWMTGAGSRVEVEVA